LSHEAPWEIGNRSFRQAGEDSESCCLPACARYSCGKGYVPNPQVALQGGKGWPLWSFEFFGGLRREPSSTGGSAPVAQKVYDDSI